MDSFKKLLSNPQLNGWGFFVGILGLLFAIYAYWDAQSFPNLLAQVHPSRAILVLPEGAQDLTILADGKQIKGPVTSAQISIWNAGSKPIKTEDILEKIQIKTNKPTPLISVRVLRTTRTLTNFTTDLTEASSGVVGINFKILEKGDGALLQITYEGDERLEFTGMGVIVGQSAFKVTKLAVEENKKETKYHSTNYNKLMIIFAIFMASFFLYRMIPGIRLNISELINVLKGNKSVVVKIIKIIEFTLGAALLFGLGFTIYRILIDFNIQVSPFLAG